MKIKTRAYNNIQVVLKFLKDRTNEQHAECIHPIRVTSSDFQNMPIDSVADTIRYLEKLEYIEASIQMYYPERYYEIKKKYIELDEKLNKSIFNQSSCAGMAIRCFTNDGKILQSLSQELKSLEHNAKFEILITPTKRFNDGCVQFGITGKGAIVYRFLYDEKSREVSINKQVFHKCSLNSMPDEFLTAAMKTKRYGDPIIWDASKREPGKILNDIKLSKVISRLFFAPLAKDGNTFTFRQYVTESDIEQENISTKKVNLAIKKLVHSS